MIWTEGRIVKEAEDGRVYILTRRPPEGNLSEEMTIGWKDGRMLSEGQRRRAYALIGEICAWAGYSSYEKESLNADMKRRFLTESVDKLTAEAIRMFSLGNTDMTTARLYNDFLTDFVLEHDIPTRVPLVELVDDVQRYVYSCLIHKKCAVCGKKADLHHCEGSAVGMGRNRREIPHEGLEVMPLCREHHSECHTIGQNRFNQRYHLDGGIRADKTICKKYGLKEKEA